MQLLKHVRAAANAVGARVVDESAGRWNVLQVEAPRGKQWRDGGCHNLKVEWPRGESAETALKDAISRINVGLVDSDDED